MVGVSVAVKGGHGSDPCDGQGVRVEVSVVVSGVVVMVKALRVHMDMMVVFSTGSVSCSAVPWLRLAVRCH